MDAVFLALIFCGYDHSLRHLTKEMWRTAMSLALTGAERSIGQRYNDLGQRLAQQLGDLVSDLQQRGEVRADIDPILIAKMLFNNFTAMYIAFAKYLVMYLETLKTKVAGQMALISNLIENAPQMSKYNQPLSGNEMIRTGGPATFMRLPSQPTAQGLDVCFIGIPMDIGTSNRPGARLGPRQIRDESRMLRPYNMATGAAPFANMQVADIGDVPINTFDLKKSVDIITDFYADILTHGTISLTLGGDHTLTWPILRAIREKLGPVAFVHVDAHADINDEMFGEKVAHGCPFRRAWEDGCLINEKVYQIGLRGMDICTGCGPGAMKGPMKGATIGHAKQRLPQGRYIGLSEPGIIAAEPPNPIVNELVIMPDIEKRLESFIRTGHGIIVFPGGVGTLEEILYLLGVLLHPDNANMPFPLIFTGPASAAEYFEKIHEFIGRTLGTEAQAFYQIIVDDPALVAAEMLKGMKRVRKFRKARNDAYYFNWLLKVDHEFQVPFEPNHTNMRGLQIHRDQPAYMLAANLRRAFSGLVAGNVKEEGIRAVEQHGLFEISGEPQLMAEIDALLLSFAEQHRMKLPGTKYNPCYKII